MVVLCVDVVGFRYESHKMFSIAMIAIVVAGFPLGMGALLFKNKDRLDEDEFAASYGHLYDKYRPGMYYWEIVEQLRKLVLVGLSLSLPLPALLRWQQSRAGKLHYSLSMDRAFIDIHTCAYYAQAGVIVFAGRGTILQLLCGTLICVAAHLAHATLSPFEDPSLHRLQHAALLSLWLTLLGGLALQTGGVAAQERSGSAVGGVVAGLSIIVMVAGVVVAISAAQRAMTVLNRMTDEQKAQDLYVDGVHEAGREELCTGTESLEPSTTGPRAESQQTSVEMQELHFDHESTPDPDPDPDQSGQQQQQQPLAGLQVHDEVA